MSGMSYQGITGEVLPDPSHTAIPESVWNAAKSNPDEFLEMALKSLNADSKVWGVIGSTYGASIFVSFKSSVKDEILDKSVWKQLELGTSNNHFQFGYNTLVDGHKSVFIYFLNKGVSVFDLVKLLNTSVRNLEGFTVSPTKWDMSKTVSWSPEPFIDDEIPF